MRFLYYIDTDGEQYSLRWYQISALKSNGPDQTYIWASVDGEKMKFMVTRPHGEVSDEVQQARDNDDWQGA